MKHLLLLSAILITLPLTALTEHVNPLIGTDFHGHTYPGAIVPFGQIQPGPDTRLSGWDGCSGYHFSDDTIYGFSHTHLNGTGCADYCDILMMPVLPGESKPTAIANRKFYLSRFSHANETATPGYYSVLLDRYKIKAELTTSERVAVHRYTFPDNKQLKAVVIDLQHRDKIISTNIEKTDNKTITGFRISSAWNPKQYCYFALQSSVPFKDVEIVRNNTKAVIYFSEKTTEVELYVSISGVDCDGAMANLKTRGKLEFDEIRAQATQKWEDKLSKIELKGATQAQLTNFYTALYHCYTSPYIWSDVDGRYRGQDNQIHTAENGHIIYTVFSLWDTYRALHPLMSIIEPKITHDFVYTMLKHFEQGGELTMWELAANETHCMIGYHAAPVILDAYRTSDTCRMDKGLMLPLLRAMVATSNRSQAHRNYGRMGYLTSEDDNESVSKNLEYSYDDWCIAQFARLTADAVGGSGFTDSVYHAYMARSQSWMNIMDRNGFMRARRNGAFVTPFNPTEVNNHFTEANSWQYSSYVPHDIYKWAQMLGGNDKAIAFLDSLFSTSSQTSGRQQCDITGLIGQYAHGNEPSHHAAYLYAYLGQPEKTERLVHQILETLYTPKPDGLCGNEDCGQMSAWYVLSSMGFYPVCPGSGEYVTVRPLFSQVTIHRPAGDMVINYNSWPTGKYLHLVGSDHNPSLPDNVQTEHAPSLLDNVQTEHAPSLLDNVQTEHAPSLLDTTINSKQYKMHFTPAPYFNDWQQLFEDSTVVRLACRDVMAKIYYTTDGTTPTAESTLYTKPFTVRSEMTIKAIAISAENVPSIVVEHRLTPQVVDRKVTYVISPDPQYIENGEQGLVDRLHGSANYRIGGWQGWQGNMEVIVDLLDTIQISYVGIECLENINSWILFPSSIEIAVSADNEEFFPVGKIANTDLQPSADRYDDYTIHEFSTKLPNLKVRYVRITAHNYGKLPSWHLSAGQRAWLFVDEIDIH